jgi:uncharacterized repeat protein (TIGR04138 family)
VLDALNLAFERARGGAGKPSNVSAADVCRALRDHAREYFNDEAEAAECLRDWKLGSSEDVGAVVFVLVEYGRLLPCEGDSIESFRGLFNLNDLFARPPGVTDAPESRD